MYSADTAARTQLSFLSIYLDSVVPSTINNILDMSSFFQNERSDIVARQPNLCLVLAWIVYVDCMIMDFFLLDSWRIIWIIMDGISIMYGTCSLYLDVMGDSMFFFFFFFFFKESAENSLSVYFLRLKLRN